MRTRSRPRSPGSAGDSSKSAGPWRLAWRRLRRDRGALVFGALLILIVLAALLWAFVAQKWSLFPDEGYVGLTDNPFEWARHLILPWIAAGLPFAGAYVLVVRASLLNSVNEDWVRTARSKGLSEQRVIRRHVLRTGLIPPVNVWGLDFSHAFGGFALYVEAIFGLPGVGFLTADTIGSFDLPPIVALGIYLAIVVVLAGALVDIAVAWIDPRIRRPRPST